MNPIAIAWEGRDRSPGSLTKQWLDEQGATWDTSERMIPHKPIKIDLFGFADLVAAYGGRIVGIQTTTGDHHANRRTKILGNPKARSWAENGGRILIVSWVRHKPGRLVLGWSIRVEEIDVEDFRLAAAQAEAENVVEAVKARVVA